MIEESPGVVSSHRVILLFAFFFCVVNPVVFWQTSLAFGLSVQIPDNMLEFLKWSFGAACALKAANAAADNLGPRTL